jgi:hypothetical protein
MGVSSGQHSRASGSMFMGLVQDPHRGADPASGEIVTELQVLWAVPAVRVLLLITMAAAGLAGMLAARFARMHWVVAAGLVASLGLVCAVTLYPVGLPAGPANSALTQCWRTFTPSDFIGHAFRSSGGLANVVLYVPLGFFFVRAGLRMPWAVVTAAAISCATELLQALSGSRVCSPDDVASNLAGAFVGGLAALAVGRAAQASRPARSGD